VVSSWHPESQSGHNAREHCGSTITRLRSNNDLHNDCQEGGLGAWTRCGERWLHERGTGAATRKERHACRTANRGCWEALWGTKQTAQGGATAGAVAGGSWHGPVTCGHDVTP
jgi:hypothetical protein